MSINRIGRPRLIPIVWIKCSICNKETTNQKYCSNLCRVRGYIGKDSSGYHQGMKGKVGWSKGLTVQTDERIKRMTEAHRGQISWSKGKQRTEEDKVKIRVGWTLEKRQQMSEKRKQNNPGGFKKGCIHSTKNQTKATHVGIASMSQKKHQNYLNGQPIVTGYPGFLAKDLGHFVRSGWEANVARFLNFCNVAYEYEKRRFDLDELGTYVPDFYLPYWKMYIEVKGNWRNSGNLEKPIKCMAQYGVQIMIIDREKYEELCNLAKEMVPSWNRRWKNAHSSQSIKT